MGLSKVEEYECRPMEKFRFDNTESPMYVRREAIRIATACTSLLLRALVRLVISHVNSGYGLSLSQSVDARDDRRTESGQLSARFMGLLKRRVDVGEKQPEASTFLWLGEGERAGCP